MNNSEIRKLQDFNLSYNLKQKKFTRIYVSYNLSKKAKSYKPIYYPQRVGYGVKLLDRKVLSTCVLN